MRKSSIIKKYYFILSVVLFLLPTQTVIAVLPFDSDLNLVQQAQVERLIGELGVTNSAVMGNKFEKPKVNDSIPRIVDIAESRLEQIMKIERVTDESGSFFDQDDNLRQFGYDLFAGSPLTFAPITDAPIPSD